MKLSPKRLHLGHKLNPSGKTTKRPYYLHPHQRSTHLHVIGSTGTGKSKFLEHLIREDILSGHGLCLIDPHGYLYNDLVRWCETHRLLKRKNIILFDPTERDWSFSFNPLKNSGAELSFQVDKMVQAVAQVWGGENTDRTPLLKRNLRMIFQVLAEKELTFLESIFLTDATDNTIRQYLIQDLTDPFIKSLWEYVNDLKPRPFMDEFGSAVNRLMDFLSAPVIRQTLGLIKPTLDLRQVMDDGAILLVNLAAKDQLSDDNARLLGTLIVNDLFMKCRSRPAGSRPFYLYIDECARYINNDIARILDEGRKFGLHLILAHQHLAQLSEVSQTVYRSVLTDAKAKVVFGGLTAEDARIIAENIFAGEIELQEVKEVLSRPVTIGQVKALVRNYSQNHSHTTGTSTLKGTFSQDTVGQSHTVGQSRTRSKTSGQSQGQSSQSNELFNRHEVIADAHSRGHSTNTAANQGSSTSIGSSESCQTSRSHTEGENFVQGQSEQTTDGESWGVAETFVPVLEDRPTSTYSLEEQINRAMWLMMNQATQYAIVKLPDRPTQPLKTPFIKDGFANDDRVKRFKNQVYQQTPFCLKREASDTLINQRLEEIREQALLDSYPEEPTSFREPPPANYSEEKQGQEQEASSEGKTAKSSTRRRFRD